MAKDDYFVVVYKILGYLYDCMKEGVAPKISDYTWDSEAIGINRQYWIDIITNLAEEDYIRGVQIVKRLGTEPALKLDNVKITTKGIEYLEENSKMSKLKGVVKTVFDTVGIFV